MPTPFTCAVVELIQRIPQGRVATYGGIAALAGSARGARQVVRVLHSMSEKEQLPWHRVVNREGKIALQPGRGNELQRMLLEKEGVVFDARGRIDLERFLWKPDSEG